MAQGYYNKTQGTEKDLWETPADLLASIQAFGSYLGTKGITLDPATTKENPTNAQRIRTPECDPDGLKTEWWYVAGDDSLIYVNPPYRQIWYDKIMEESQQLRATQHMIALLPAKVGTNYFQDLAEFTSSVLFVRGRLTFDGATQPAPFESALLYFGRCPRRFSAHFERMGWAV